MKFRWRRKPPGGRDELYALLNAAIAFGIEPPAPAQVAGLDVEQLAERLGIEVTRARRGLSRMRWPRLQRIDGRLVLCLGYSPLVDKYNLVNHHPRRVRAWVPAEELKVQESYALRLRRAGAGGPI